jgi:hypothetical protein
MEILTVPVSSSLLLLALVAGAPAAPAKTPPPQGAAFLSTDAKFLAAPLSALLVEEGFTVRHIDGEYQFFDGLGPIMLGSVDTPRPGFWPPDLEADWTNATQLCQKHAGPPPYNAKNKEAFLCGRDIGPWLWQKWLDREKPAKVVRVGFSGAENKPGDVTVTVYGPNETSTVDAKQANVTLDQAATTAVTLARSTLRGQGNAGKRDVVRDLPMILTPETPYLKAGKVIDIGAVTVPAACTGKLPAELEVRPADAALAGNIVALWKKSVGEAGAKGQKEVCELSGYRSSVGIMGTAMRSHQLRLKCGTTEVADRVPGISLEPDPFQKTATEKLVNKLVKARCPEGAEPAPKK